MLQALDIYTVGNECLQAVEYDLWSILLTQSSFLISIQHRSDPSLQVLCWPPCDPTLDVSEPAAQLEM